MKYIKYLLLAALCFGFFFYGMISLEYKIFPYQYIMAIKVYFKQQENQLQSTETINTFFRRLLVKKVFIDEDLFRGGGIATIDPYIFIITSKGKVLAYNQDTYSKVALAVENVPMNYDQLLNSDYPQKDDFKIAFFRVSGIHAEKNGEGNIDLFVSNHFYDQQNDCIQHRITKIELSPKGNSLQSEQSWNTIFTAKPCIELNPEHYVTVEPFVGHEGGGKIIEYNDSTLMVSVGEYGRNGLNKTESFSQDPNVPYGKIILVNKTSGKWSVFTEGMRNPLGLYKDQNGNIWETENGPRGGDELNIIQKGANYGWPDVSYGVWYDDSFEFNDNKPRGVHSGYIEPVYAWLNAVAPSNLTRIEGKKFDTWKGDLIIGTMKDKSLQRVRLSVDNRAVYLERIPLGHRVRDLLTLSDDTIALVTDDGFLIFIDDGGSSLKTMSSNAKERMSKMNLFDGFAEERSGPQNHQTIKTAKDIFVRNCANCHTLNQKNSIGPNLVNLFQRKVGDLNDFNYSSVLLNDDRKWSPPLLRTFLLEPESEFPNNQMGKISLSATEVDSIITYLKKSGN